MSTTEPGAEGASTAKDGVRKLKRKEGRILTSLLMNFIVRHFHVLANVGCSKKSS